MSSIKYGRQTMNGIDSITDGVGFLENGILTCNGVVAIDIQTKNLIVDNGVVSNDIQTKNINVENNITGGESLAIGRDIAVGSSLICPNIYTTKLITNTIDTKSVKTEKIELFNNLLKYGETNVGFIKSTKPLFLAPFKLQNTFITLGSLPLPLGIFIVSYSFSLDLTASTGGNFTGISHGLSTNNSIYNVISRNFYGNVVFGNPNSNPVFNETAFFHNTNYNGSIYLLANNNTLTSGVSLVVLKTVVISALRIA